MQVRTLSRRCVGTSAKRFLSVLALGMAYNVAQANSIPFGVNVTDFGADPSGVRDSTKAFNDAIRAIQNRTGLGSGTVYIPGGDYRISEQIRIPNGLSLQGPRVMEGAILNFKDQTSGFSALLIEGTYTGSIEGLVIANAHHNGIAILYAQSNRGDYRVFCRLSDIKVQDAGNDGFFFQNAWMLSLERLWSVNNGRTGFYFDGGHTSIDARNLFAATNRASGFFISNTAYSSFTACGSDSNDEWGYMMVNSSGITMNSCGAEGNQLAAIELATSDGWARAAKFGLTDQTGIAINGFFSLGNNRSNTSGVPEFLRINSNDERLIHGQARQWVSQDRNGHPPILAWGTRRFNRTADIAIYRK